MKAIFCRCGGIGHLSALEPQSFRYLRLSKPLQAKLQNLQSPLGDKGPVRGKCVWKQFDQDIIGGRSGQKFGEQYFFAFSFFVFSLK